MSRILILLTLLSLLVVIVPHIAEAQAPHQLVRRLVVFPVKTGEGSQVSSVGEEAWWQTREEFTKSRRFLVASKQFLVKTDAYQPRGELEPADAILLGKLLDAHALVTLKLDDRRLTMNVYDGGNGLPLWQKTVTLHPSVTVGDQLPELARKIAGDFIASIPYQGFTIVDSLIGQPVYEEGDTKLTQIDLGTTSKAQIGDQVQWISLVSTTGAPLFQGGGKMTIFAEGRVVRLEQGVATVEITRAASMKEIKEYSLVRLPREAERLKAEYTLLDQPKTTLTAELITPEARPMEQVAKERKPLMAALSFIGSLTAFLLLAF